MKTSPRLYEDIRSMLIEARKKVYASINIEMIIAYWRIGERVVEEEQAGEKRADYGAQLIDYLSKRLSDEFGKGFSPANIWNFRQFYLTFPETNFLYALRRELTWTHYRSIMRVANPDARQYYIREAADNNWSTRQLDRNINTLYYERLLSTKNKETLTPQPKMESTSPKDIIKDPYVLEVRRGTLLYIPRPPGGIFERKYPSQPAYLEPKGEGENSMLVKQ